jgi:hypothetical protein
MGCGRSALSFNSGARVRFWLLAAAPPGGCRVRFRGYSGRRQFQRRELTYSSNLLTLTFTGTGVGPRLANLVEGNMTNLPGPAFFEISGETNNSHHPPWVRVHGAQGIMIVSPTTCAMTDVRLWPIADAPVGSSRVRFRG